ncbi:putative disease resistance protein [Tanacetum coccineum]
MFYQKSWKRRRWMLGFWPPNLCTLCLGKLEKPISEWGWQNFPLVNLSLYGGPSEEDVTSCSQLSLYDLLPSSLNRIWINDFTKLETLSVGLQHLISLQHLIIVNCPKITCLPVTLLPSLFNLEIRNCSNLEEKYNRKGRCSVFAYKVIMKKNNNWEPFGEKKKTISKKVAGEKHLVSINESITAKKKNKGEKGKNIKSSRRIREESTKDL